MKQLLSLSLLNSIISISHYNVTATVSLETKIKIELNTYLPGVGVQGEVRHVVVSVLRGCRSLLDPQNPSPVSTLLISNFSLTSRDDRQAASSVGDFDSVQNLLKCFLFIYMYYGLFKR